jgi:hypothetical protein
MKKKIYEVSSGRGEYAEKIGVFHRESDLRRYIQFRKDRELYDANISELLVTREEAQDILEDNISDEEWAKWGVA